MRSNVNGWPIGGLSEAKHTLGSANNHSTVAKHDDDWTKVGNLLCAAACELHELEHGRQSCVSIAHTLSARLCNWRHYKR